MMGIASPTRDACNFEDISAATNPLEISLKSPPQSQNDEQKQQHGVFEWLLGWKQLARFLGDETWVGLPIATSRVLVPGCGTSHLSVDLHTAG
jgi:hypothetical protein